MFGNPLVATSLNALALYVEHSTVLLQCFKPALYLHATKKFSNGHGMEKLLKQCVKCGQV